MNKLIDFSFNKTKAVILILITILTIGYLNYVNIPKESAPEVPIPIAYVSTSLEGISPEDGERLLLKPLETELSSIEGLKKYNSVASEGHASVTLEFEAGYPVKTAINNTKDAVDKAKNKLPEDATDPTVTEINTALFPILTIIVTGEVPITTLNNISDKIKEDLESIKGVLEVDINGSQDEIAEITISKNIFETYNLSFQEIIQQVNSNNRLVAAGNLDTPTGKFLIKSPGLIQNIDDILNMPIKVSDKKVVKFSDIAEIRRVLKDPDGYARINGSPAIALEVKKKVGENIIQTIENVKEQIALSKAILPESVKFIYLQDESKQVKSMLKDLENNVIASVLLVMIVILFTLGVRSSILIGLSIPGSFLAGVIILNLLGYTMNIVVLFALILVVGMLVDGAIVTTEYADRKMLEGENPKNAFKKASKRMAWPIIASTATTLCVFLPLLFWRETVGQFMKYLPITVIATLGSSLLMALVFIPVLGGFIGKKNIPTKKEWENLLNIEYKNPKNAKGIIKLYINILEWVIINPKTSILICFMAIASITINYGNNNQGASFFPSIEPDFGQIQVKSNDNLSLNEKNKIMMLIEEEIMNFTEIKNTYSKTQGENKSSGEDTIGIIQIELDDWNKRRTFSEISEDIKSIQSKYPGILIQTQGAAAGPAGGKPINLKILSNNDINRLKALNLVTSKMYANEGFQDISTSESIPGIEWKIKINREKAASYGANINLIGETIKLLTRGIKIADYTPSDSNEVVDIIVRFDKEDRTLNNISNLNIPTQYGLVPISNFVEITPEEKTGIINRFNGEKVTTIEADVKEGFLVNELIMKLQEDDIQQELNSLNVKIQFSGEAEDQQKAMTFLLGAFLFSIFLMFLILLIQFNSFWQTAIVMSAILFSIVGVLLGLLIMGRPFGIVMSGIGIIALAGIVVNNNIILIDTFNEFRAKGQTAMESALRAGASRLRPVILTSVTTSLGLIPMVFGLNINFQNREILIGSPSTQWWIELSTTIAGGLLVATLITLLITPALLVLPENIKKIIGRKK